MVCSEPPGLRTKPLPLNICSWEQHVNKQRGKMSLASPNLHNYWPENFSEPGLFRYLVSALIKIGQFIHSERKNHSEF